MSNYKKILLLTSEIHPTNRAIINELWLKEFVKNNKVTWISESKSITTFLCKEGDNLFFKIPKYCNLPVFRTVIMSFVKWVLIFNFLRNEKVDVLQVRNGILESYLALFFSKFYSIPFAFHLSSMHAFDDVPLISKYKSGINKFLYIIFIKYKIYHFKKIITCCDIFMPISRYMNERLKKIMPLKNKLTFPLNLSGSSLYLETKKIKTKSIVVSFTGAIGWREELLLEIVEKTVSKKKDIVFLFVCLTSKHMFSIKKIKEMAEENFLLKHIHFFFNQPYNKVPDILKYSDLGLSLIPPEQKFIVSSPSKLVDYMSLGIPVICNEEILEQKEIIQHTQGGVLVKYNSNEVSKAILDLVQNKNKMAEMGKKAKKWIYENRTFEKSSLAMEKVYEKVISRKE